MPRPLSSKVPLWFERKFDFTFPAEQYPNVCVRLWGTPARLEEILRKVTTDVLVGKLYTASRLAPAGWTASKEFDIQLSPAEG